MENIEGNDSEFFIDTIIAQENKYEEEQLIKETECVFCENEKMENSALCERCYEKEMMGMHKDEFDEDLPF